MYPSAKVLTVTPRSFTPAKRQRVLEDIRDHDYDGIIMAYSCFELIPLSKEYYLEEIESKKQEIETRIETVYQAVKEGHHVGIGSFLGMKSGEVR